MISYYEPSDAHGLILEVNSGTGSLSVRFRDETLIVHQGIPPALSCLVPNSHAQNVNADSAITLEHAARTGMDMLSLELKHRYPAEADLSALRRVLSLRRTPPSGVIELLDGVSFALQPGILETVFLTGAAIEISEKTVFMRGERGELQIAYDPKLVTTRMEQDVNDDSLSQLVFVMIQPRKSGAIRLIINPVQASTTGI